MIRILEDLPDDVLGVEAQGKITHEDYEKILIPAAEEKLKAHDKVKMLYRLADLEGFEMAAMWDDTAFGLKHWTDFSKIALVSDYNWIRAMTALFKPFFPGEVKIFNLNENDAAKKWITA